MTGLLAPRRPLHSTCLALALGLTPLSQAWAAPPSSVEAATVEQPASPETNTERFAPRPPAPERAFTTEGPLRLVDSATEGASEEAEPEPAPAPAPAPLELTGYTEALAPSFERGPQPRRVDSKRPNSGTATMALGGLTLTTSSALFFGGLAGPGWLGLDRDEAIIVGAMALPTALIGAGLLVGGTKVNKRYRGWARRNDLNPPKTGNALIVIGGAVTLGFTGIAAHSANRAATRATRERGDWAPAIVAGGFASLGAIMLAGGASTRSKFDRWERSGYLAPGALALKGGGGLSISGRF